MDINHRIDQSSTREDRLMKMARQMIAASLAAAVLVAAFACGASEPTRPSVDGPVAPTVSSPDGSPATTSWRTDYSAEQLAAYDQAVARFVAYEQESEPIWAAGRATPAAKRLFRDFFPAPAWQLVFGKLQSYEGARVTVAGVPVVVWSRAKRITLSVDGGGVVVTQCADYTGVKTSQYGVVVDREDVFDGPIERTLVMKQSGAGAWLIFDFREPTAETARACSAKDVP